MYYEKYMNRVYTSSGWASDADFADSMGCLTGSWEKRPEEGGVVLFNRILDIKKPRKIYKKPKLRISMKLPQAECRYRKFFKY